MKIKPPLSYAERLFLARRRAGLTLGEAARRIGISERRYSLSERGLKEYVPTAEIRGEISAVEYCVIKRRRAGLLQREVAQRIGRSRVLVVHMERGEAPVKELLAYWGE